MARKRVLPHSFPLTERDWREIYYCVGDDIQRKLQVDGKGVTERHQRRLSEVDWIQIYESLVDKRDRLRAGFYGRDSVSREWRQHIEAMLDTLSVIAEKFIGKQKPQHTTA